MSIPGIGSSFAERLRYAMDQAEVNQTQLGKAIKAPQQVVSSWVDDEGSLPSGKLMVKLPAALKVSGHWLLTGELPIKPLGADADALIKHGIQLGLQWAEESMRTLRTADGGGLPPALAALATSAARDSGGDLADLGERKLEELAEDQQADATTGAAKPRGKASRRSRGAGGA